ncbi:hypothetical protein S7711_02277 [Stachybotrys chartarum IBT 7711]|uniref:Transcription factor domain-containing protein n=1 Tax=Stachybotrys chartarum (strain CBS 109288 / IBT 7711) TaxID=1280523 RepID=A0A084B0T4_STACB|nr:hypothetical protein S7711_02277 [Stachybotrys chartarum IBT 7711]KFA52718.1 hypothetical protein S40293_08477 [Stachybotrys chartarum IBT 40293]KFA70796.1 hypothetical protein S40288_09630 [Stachybotrys chartarum IBT 40288]
MKRHGESMSPGLVPSPKRRCSGDVIVVKPPPRLSQLSQQPPQSFAALTVSLPSPTSPPALLYSSHDASSSSPSASPSSSAYGSPLATTIASSTGTLLDASPCQPSVAELTWHFSTVLSPCLVFGQHEATNPFQELLLPLTLDGNASITHAVCAFASAHLEVMGLAQPGWSSDYYNLALARLASQIEGGQDHEMALAAILTLVSYEVLVRERPSDIIEHHLRGAYFLLKELHDKQTPLTSFLERQFRYYDAIVALSLGTSPVAEAPSLTPLQPDAPPLDSCGIGGGGGVHLDPLLGMAADLWPILYRLSGMLPLKRDLDDAITGRQPARTSVLRAEMNASSRAIEAALHRWMPPPLLLLPDQDPADALAQQSPRVQASVHHALAYRHSALVYLHRAIHGYPQRHRLVQTNTHSALMHCTAALATSSAVDASCTPTSGLLWPLFTAACEAIDEEDRDMASQVFDAMRRRQRMINIDHAWYVMARVWSRVDENLTRGVRAEDTLTVWRDAEAALGLKVILS